MTTITERIHGKLNAKNILIGIGILLLIVASFLLPVQNWAKAYQGWLESLGWFGWVAFVIIYAIATVFLVPGALLTLAGGLAFGLWGFPLVLAGATTGASIAFLAGRYFVRNRVERAIENYPKFKAVDSAIKDEGWKVVGLLRLSPAVPFSLQNWFLGTTQVNFISYVIATFIGIMPGTLLYVWIGSLGATSSSENSTAKYIFLGVGLLATLAVTILISKKASSKLEDHSKQERQEE